MNWQVNPLGWYLWDGLDLVVFVVVKLEVKTGCGGGAICMYTWTC